MYNPAAWFERKFDIAVPLQLLPNVMARLRGAPARLEETVRGFPHEMLTHKPQQKWSAQEHAGHLLDLEPLWLARVEDYVSSASQLTVADLTNRSTHQANHNARPIEEILRGFRSARMLLLGRVAAVEQAAFTRAIPHPRLKTPMRLIDHLHFVAEHDDHHLAHIWALTGAQSPLAQTPDMRK
jgi:uncharacterized damage-inducible protein DinB